MPKFSIIIPVYNTEKYLERCLDSVLTQDFKNYEIIIINDGSTDDSEKIIKNYLKLYKNIKYINLKKKEKLGPSTARNVGVSNANGEYILFLDSDDYYENDLLKKLNDNLQEQFDIIRFQIQYDNEFLKKHVNINEENRIFSSGIDAFNYICNYSIIESPCCYAFKRTFFIQNKFKFTENTFHEDFGLIPLVILKAKSIKCLDYIGYNYFQRAGSIMNSDDYEKTKKKALDFLEHFKFLKKESSKISADLAIFNSYIANSLIIKATTLKGEDYRKYIKEIRENNVFEMLLEDTFLRKIKKILISIDPKIYYKIVRR